MNSSIDDAAFEYASLTDMANAAGLSPSFVSRCKSGGQKKLPIQRAKQIHRRIGCPLHLLRPDVWDAPDDDMAAA